MNRVRRGAPVIACLVWILGMSCSEHGQDIVETPGGYRSLPPLCLPCGEERSLGIATAARFDEVFAELGEACGDSQQETDWRQRVEGAGVDFDREALVIVWDWVGTQGKASLEVEEPTPGALTLALAWDIPSGPALPVATAACFCLAVDKTMVNQVEVTKAGASVVSMTF